MKTVLIVDSLNVFIRHFMVSETMNSVGEMVGGALGFVGSIGSVIGQLKPNAVVVVWEKGGASSRRKSICPQYKANRAAGGNNPAMAEMSYRGDGKFRPAVDKTNKVFQIQLCTKLLKCLPVCQLYVENTEADDIIAYLTTQRFGNREEPVRRIIMSSDKDFYQLLEDDNVRIYDPARKILIDKDYVETNFGVTPRNITLARSVIGDPSDNLDGVDGIGFKTISKRMPEFMDRSVDLDAEWLEEKCKESLNEIAAAKPKKKAPACFGDIVENIDVVKRNWKLMYLGGTNALAASQISQIDGKLDEWNQNPNAQRYDKLLFMQELLRANIPFTSSLETCLESMLTLARNTKTFIYE